MPFLFDARDQAQIARLLRTECPTGEEQVERAVLAHDGGQMRIVDRRQHPDIDLRISERRGVRGNDHVAGNRDRHPAAPHRASYD
ncbi:hypothetical protein D3C73_1503440 [compost metagenome]